MSENPSISGKEKRILKSSAKTRNVDIKIGKKGLTQNVIQEIQFILKRDRMVKVSFREDRDKRAELINSLQKSLNSNIIELVGKTATFAS